MTEATLKKNSLWMMGGQALRAGVQLLYFVLIARALGSAQYGSFVAVTALVAIVAPFASWGSGNLLIKHTVRDRRAFSTYWGAAVATTLTTSLALTLVVVAVAQLALPPGLPLALLVLVALSDLLFARLIDVAGQAFQAFQRLDRTAALQLLPALVRLAAAALLFVLPVSKTALVWSSLFVVSTAISAACALVWVRRDLGWGPLSMRPVVREAREGGAFALSLSAQSIYNDIDKIMLARLVSTEAAGIYAAAYRIVDTAFTPVRSVLYAAYARFFQRGQAGLSGSTAFALQLLPWTGGYSLLVAGALWLAAPILPLLFGSDFAATSEVLRWLSPLVLLKTLHYFAADALTGAGYQGTRSVVQVAVAVLNGLLNLWLLPRYGWLGAVWASLASDLLLALVLWGIVGFKARKSPHPKQNI
ncbi:lipopolysaccharide biosynthesis protein [Deinococcus humi]|uniref:O-antigen/teichoic acid export membrane protein n=1 Tax=Deinococcus humi TaxID=662880 RepID=A0A7W8JXF9_9DEIO|nr:oligosaccharide flippase family protein [Deinococcus humi]MBB5363444.1 O-antigen/teichoic acid export membrane protein [Deinococcus humi]GGO26472.1 polysaccharide biosynthesis protein [Deinococcus humi]